MFTGWPVVRLVVGADWLLARLPPAWSAQQVSLFRLLQIGPAASAETGILSARPGGTFTRLQPARPPASQHGGPHHRGLS